MYDVTCHFNPIALRKAKTLSQCSRVKYFKKAEVVVLKVSSGKNTDFNGI